MNDEELIKYISAYEVSTSEIEKRKIIGKINNITTGQFKFFLQHGPKSNWWVQSEILIKLGYPKIKPILNDLFNWFKDLNWPGAVDIYDKLLINVEKKELVKSLDSVIHQAYWEGDSQWIYWLGIFVKEANLDRDDFSQTNNAYDVILLFDKIYPDGNSRDTWDEIMETYLELFKSWGYPRISQFIPSILAFLRHENSQSSTWKMHKEILDLIPEEIKNSQIKQALRKLYDLGKITEIGHLREIIPIGDSIQDFQKYIYS